MFRVDHVLDGRMDTLYANHVKNRQKFNLIFLVGLEGGMNMHIFPSFLFREGKVPDLGFLCVVFTFFYGISLRQSFSIFSFQSLVKLIFILRFRFCC